MSGYNLSAIFEQDTTGSRVPEDGEPAEARVLGFLGMRNPPVIQVPRNGTRNWHPHCEDLWVPHESYQTVHIKRTGEQVQHAGTGAMRNSSSSELEPSHTSSEYNELQAEYKRGTHSRSLAFPPWAKVRIDKSIWESKWSDESQMSFRRGLWNITSPIRETLIDLRC
jgi:hypothetical protein